MNNYRNDRSAGGKKFGGFAGKGTWNRAGAGKPVPRELHDAVCGNCGNHCQVPFFPSGSRPVFCRDCFRKDEGESPRRFDDRRPAPRPFSAPESNDGAMDARLRKIEKKLDMILELLDADAV
jgi:CxxC-x17-CxxC domain-containing protein